MNTIEPTANYPELLSDLAAQADRLFQEKGIPGDKASEVAWELAEYLRTHWAKQTLYFPQAVSLEARRRAADMWAKFNGRNVEELAKEFDVTVQHAYRMLRFMRAETVLRSQGKLFDDGDVPTPNLR